MPKSTKSTTPKVQKGVISPGSLNPNLRLKKRKPLEAEQLVEGILKKDRILLSKAITLIESQHPKHQQLAQEIIERCLPHSGQSLRIGITGSPGVGKSSFIEAYGLQLIEQGKNIAVLAIDPSSQVTQGSILGDKTRMEKLSVHNKAFIRPSPAGSSLGGVARKTRETIILCEAAGFDTIIIETVGVGQSEVAVHSMVDFFLLLLLPGGGDELQGIKRGIVEMADFIAVNKADEERLALAKKAKRAYQNALHLFPPKENGWLPKVAICSAINGFGIPEIGQYIDDFQKQVKQNGYFSSNRLQQSKYWLYETINQQLQHSFYESAEIKEKLAAAVKAVTEGKQTSFKAANELLAIFQKKNDFNG